MSRQNPESPDRSRRSFLRGAALAVPGLMLLSPWERLLASTPRKMNPSPNGSILIMTSQRTAAAW